MTVLRDGESTGVGPVALFFGLVHAFAITQLLYFLLRHLDLAVLALIALIGFALPVLAALAFTVLLLPSPSASGWFRLSQTSVRS